jgi:hypothetical protein
MTTATYTIKLDFYERMQSHEQEVVDKIHEFENVHFGGPIGLVRSVASDLERGAERRMTPNTQTAYNQLLEDIRETLRQAHEAQSEGGEIS